MITLPRQTRPIRIHGNTRYRIDDMRPGDRRFVPGKAENIRVAVFIKAKKRGWKLVISKRILGCWVERVA